ncbi:MAG: ATP-binding protein [Candidatus Kaelpia aquatica]|nr:ATP-binding protein [Candidatus Kaelpia aquatica]
MIKIGPVAKEEFSSREKEVERLKKIKNDYLDGYRRNLAILGPWSIGKTSLILKFIHDDLGEDLFPIYLNLEEGFLKESFLGFLLHSLRRFSLVDSNFFIDSAAESGRVIDRDYPAFSSIVRNIELGLKNNNYELLMSSILRLPLLIKKEFKKNSLFVIDEFFGLSKLKLNYWMQILREHIMLDEHALFILMSSDQDRSKSVLNSELSLLFGNFEIMELDKFSYQESRGFIESRMGKIREMNDVAIDRLITLTAGVPLYLDILTSWVQENVDRFDSESLILVIRENLINNKGFLYRFFGEKLKNYPGVEKFQEFLPFIIEIARGNTKKKSLKKLDLSYADSGYSMNGFLEKNGSFFRIKDPLFRIWLLYAYSADLMGLGIGFKARMEMLEKELDCVNFGSNLFHSDKPMLEIEAVVKELILKFDNEFIDLSGKRKQLPKILSLEKESQGQNYVLFCAKREGAGHWLFLVVSPGFKEQDSYAIIERLKDSQVRFNQKIAIVPNQLEDNNVNLILKTKGFWIWDMEFLTKLCEFYSVTGKNNVDSLA